MQNSFAGLPWYIRYPGQALAALAGVAMNQFASALPPWAQPLAILAGAALTLWVVVAFIWHVVNVIREKNGRARFQLEPNHFIAIGFVVVAAGFIWQAFRSNAGAMPKEMVTKIDHLQTSFDSYVKPRSITNAQRKALVEYLLPREHMTIDVRFDHEDEEAEDFARQIFEALQEADWNVTMQEVQGGKMPDGTSMGRDWSIRTVYGSNFKGGMSKATDLLEKAFRAAGMPVPGTMGSGDPRTAKVPQDVTTIVVGHRPMVMTNAGP